MFRRFVIAFLLFMPIIPATGAEWPNEQVTIVSPFPTAGTNDLMARLVAEHLERKLKQSVVVVDKPGASGALGTLHVAKAKPDGYTLLLGSVVTHAVLPFYEADPGYDAEKDFVPIAFVARVPVLLVVNPNVPAKTVSELITYLKANPQMATYASAGAGTAQHLAGEMFKLKTGTNMTHVPFRSGNEIMDAVVTGKVQMAFNNAVWAWPLARSGKVRAIGLASLKPSANVPGVPLIADAVPGFETSTWYGLYAPADTPRPIIDKLSASVTEILKDPFVVKQLSVLGAEVEIMTPDEFSKHCANERLKWRKVVDATAAKGE
jgi:tripartite-type tricarboxylate transporter receptor subunit TctC